MRSIPTIFIRDKESRMLVDKPLRMTDWVFQGKGVATRKWDGVAIKIENNKVYRRYEWKTGEVAPVGFVRVQDPDPKRPFAGIPGWVPINERFKTEPVGPDEQALKEAWDDKLKQLTQSLWSKLDLADQESKAALITSGKEEFTPMAFVQQENKYIHMTEVPNGTYELCGPTIHGNHEQMTSHVLYKHGEHVLKNLPRTFEGLKKFLETFTGEGIVWHYTMKGESTPLMAKIKRRDFGFTTRISKEDIAMAYTQAEGVAQ